MKIGVFDSGVGGQSVVNAIKKALPEHQVIYKSDSKNVPYGNKSIKEIHKLVLPILNTLSNLGCEVIVIACNTVSTNLIEELRKEINIPLIAMEPMVKPAVKLTKTGTIAVCATPRTLSSKRYNKLKQYYAKETKVIEPDCSDWSYMIESNTIDQQKIKKLTKYVCNKGADVIVLGCTHYHWIEEDIKQIASNYATVLQPELPVIKQLKKVIAGLAA